MDGLAELFGAEVDGVQVDAAALGLGGHGVDLACGALEEALEVGLLVRADCAELCAGAVNDEDAAPGLVHEEDAALGVCGHSGEGGGLAALLGAGAEFALCGLCALGVEDAQQAALAVDLFLGQAVAEPLEGGEPAPGEGPDGGQLDAALGALGQGRDAVALESREPAPGGVQREHRGDVFGDALFLHDGLALGVGEGLAVLVVLLILLQDRSALHLCREEEPAFGGLGQVYPAREPFELCVLRDVDPVRTRRAPGLGGAAAREQPEGEGEREYQ